MPTIEIGLAYPGEAPLFGPMSAIVDTAADGTLVPTDVLARFQLVESDRTWIRSQWGEYRSALVYVLDLHIGSLLLPAVRIVEDDRGKEIILGRDVLNKLRILLDGPGEMTELLEKPKHRRR
jgi:predicted aspartyl protease